MASAVLLIMRVDVAGVRATGVVQMRQMRHSDEPHEKVLPRSAWAKLTMGKVNYAQKF